MPIREISQNESEPLIREVPIDEPVAKTENEQALEYMTKRAKPSGFQLALMQGTMMGFADEANAAIGALVNREPGEDFTDAYYRHRNEYRERLSQFQQEHPIVATTTEIAGGLGWGGISIGKQVARTVPGMMLRGGVTGSALGAIAGAGSAEEISDVPYSTLTHGLFGAGMGIAAPALMEGGYRAYRGTRALLSPETAAGRRISQAISRDQMTPKQLSEALDEAQKLGRPATVADVGGESIQRELEIAAQSPGPSGNIIRKQFESRNVEQLDRLSQDMVRGTSIEAKTVGQAISSTMKTRSEASRPLYDRAMNFQAELSDDIVAAYNNAVKSPLGKQALKKAKIILNVEKFDEAPLMERIDALKQGYDGVIGNAMRAGDSGIAAKALKVKNEMIDLVDVVNPDYKMARQTWETGSKYLDAVDTGREIMNPRNTAARVAEEFSTFTDAQKEAYRIGAVDQIITRMRSNSATEPNLIKMLRSPEMRDKLKAIMEPEAAARIDKILDIEDRMFSLASKTLRGSQTAQRLTAIEEAKKQIGIVSLTEELTSLIISPIRNIIVHKIPNLAHRTRERLLSKHNEAVARRLLSAKTEDLLKLKAVGPSPDISGLSRSLLPGALVAADENVNIPENQ